METVSIRNLRGAALRDSAREGKLLAITDHRVLIGVVVPVAQAWVEHLIDYNLSHVRQSIAEGEEAVAGGAPMVTPDDVIAGPEGTVPDQGHSRDSSEQIVEPLVAAIVGGTVTQPAKSRETLRRLQGVLSTSGLAAEQDGQPAEPSVRTVRIGDLSARVIERAGDIGQTLAVTHDRELICMVIPVTTGLVKFLVEQNLSRVLYNIGLAEKQVAAPDQITSLDQEPRA